MYGIPQSCDVSPASRAQHDTAKIQKIFSGVLPSDQPVPICRAYRVGHQTCSPAETPRPLKVIQFNCPVKTFNEPQREKVTERNPTVFHRSYSKAERAKHRALKAELRLRLLQVETGLQIKNGRLMRKKPTHKKLWRTPVQPSRPQIM